MSTSFNAKEHLMQIKSSKGSSDYLEVKWRLVWFRQECPNGSIETEIVLIDLDREVQAEAFVWNSEKRRSEKVMKTGNGVAIVKATVKDGKGGIAVGTKMENAANFGDFLEKAETGSIGRALAALGYGTQFTGDELSEGERIVDSPVEHAPATNNHAAPAQPAQQSNPTPLSSAQTPRAKDLHERSESLLPGKWEDIKARAKVGGVPDDNLTPAQCAHINRMLDTLEANRAAKAS